MAHAAEHASLARFLEKHSFKHTKQRDVILDAFLDCKGHITSDDLYNALRGDHPTIGYTTVYRTLKLLCEAGIAQERHFDDGVARYEQAQAHHDHLVCTRCGTIVEFESDIIESTQEKIALEYGYRLERHRHELYGVCGECQAEESG